MIYPTSGIVLRTVKYGETSGVVSVYTERFGMQSYLINGIRTAGKSSKAHLYQPASILEMEVYHNNLKNLQRVKESRWKRVYRSVFTDVIKNSIALFIVEVLQKTITAEEQNEQLYTFLENCFFELDEATSTVAANMPVKFMLSLPAYLGFGITNNYSENTPFFNPKEGFFSGDRQDSLTVTSPFLNQSLSDILRSSENNQPLKLNGENRRKLLYLLEQYYQYHIEGFAQLKTLRILEVVIGS